MTIHIHYFVPVTIMLSSMTLLVFLFGFNTGYRAVTNNMLNQELENQTLNIFSGNNGKCIRVIENNAVVEFLKADGVENNYEFCTNKGKD